MKKSFFRSLRDTKATKAQRKEIRSTMTRYVRMPYVNAWRIPNVDKKDCPFCISGGEDETGRLYRQD